MSDLEKAFDQKASAWEAYTQTAAGRLRETLNLDYLLPHLPPSPAQVLDVGCGTGGLGIELAKQGYHVHLLDLSSEMLNIAKAKGQQAEIGHLLTFHHQSVATWQNDRLFDAIVCHTLLEYTPHPSIIIQRLAKWLSDKGVLSLVFVNRYAEPLNLALGKGRLAQALLETEQGTADLFGVSRRLFTSAEIIDHASHNRLKVKAEYGVRLIADYAPHMNWQTDPSIYEQIVALEKKLAPQFPYYYMGRYGQLIFGVSTF